MPRSSTSNLNCTIKLATQHASEVSLLLSDVVMPEKNGRDLAQRLLSVCPHLKSLFMSGMPPT